MSKRERRTAMPTQIDPALPPDSVRAAVIGHDGTTLRDALVERAEWPDPDDLDVHDMASARRRKARNVAGYRRVSVIWNLHQRNPHEITAQHIKAAQQLTRDFEVGHEGARSAGGRGAVDGPDGAGVSERQLMALTRYRRAKEAMGARISTIVCLVVLANWPLNRLAERFGTTGHRMLGRLSAAMDRLCDHYWPEGDKSAEKPYVAPVSTPQPPPDVVDIPAERLGRWRTPEPA